MKGTQGFGLACTRAAITGTAALTLLLGACLSGEQNATEPVSDFDTNITLNGSVGDGPTINSDIVVLDTDGNQLAALKSDSTGAYRIDMNVSTADLPLLVRATGGTDIVTNTAPDFPLQGALSVIRNNNVVNLNPFSTFAVEIARDLNGGISKQSLATAEEIATKSMNSGLTTLVSAPVSEGSTEIPVGPMQTVIDAGNIAEIIKASETLGEIVRRSRDAMNDSGRGTNATAVIQALGSDLIDGVIEGNGGPRSDSRLAAITNIVAAQVLLEAMANELHVHGRDATDAMRQAIGQVVPGADATALDRLGTTDKMIEQAMNGLSAAFAVTGDQRVYNLMETLSGMQGGMEPSLVRTLLPEGYRKALDTAVDTAAKGDTSVVQTINSVMRDSTAPAGGENRAPTISGQPEATVRAGQAYDFRPTASDLDGDPLTFSIENKPGWANFDTATGRLSGTPQAGDAHRYNAIKITVSDGDLESSVGPFAIEVKVDNSGPTISGSPANSVSVGESYSFTPRASDPDGDTLTFAISGKPSWARFNKSTGKLSGTPTEADVGVYSDIRINVSDGNSRASLARFSIEVLAAGSGTGSVTLRWTPPTHNEDGSQLRDLVGYRVYWGRAGKGYSNAARIENASVTRFVVENLGSGNYEFVATAVNKAGVESRFSNAIIKTVNQ